MVGRRVAGAPLDFAALRRELGVPGDIASAVLVEADAAARAPRLPDRDATDLPLVTIDSTGSTDLDQAVHLSRQDDGYLVHYAIADVAAFVRPGSALDVTANERGETYYFPDTRVPLHPAVLSEGAASLLPDQLRPAVLWTIALHADADVADVAVERARVRSRAQLDYIGTQAGADAGALPDAVALLPEIGAKRAALARTRHAIDLDLPQQEVTRTGVGTATLSIDAPLPVESWNAQISLLTGMCAAQLMIRAGVGLLRTVPAPDHGTVEALRRMAVALGVDWSPGVPPGDVLSRLDRTDPRHLALLEHASSLLRGSGYTAFDGAAPDHEHRAHAGIGAPYAHVTAPLRRLVDRYGSEVCLAVHAGEAVPGWVRERLPALPAIMRRADTLAHDADRAVIDTTEAWLLQDRVGETFGALVLDADRKAATVLVDEPPVRARCDGEGLVAGDRIRVRLTTADVAARPGEQVRFSRERA